MTELTYGQRSWMVSHIADGLRSLGHDVTPEAVERELKNMDALRTAAGHDDDSTPPDPYEPGLAKLRAELPPNRWPEPQAAPPPKSGDYTPPDPYAAELERMKR